MWGSLVAQVVSQPVFQRARLNSCQSLRETESGNGITKLYNKEIMGE